ncbi:MAG: hypothetical protein QM811_12840 [Pirellulales bacterium]
MTLSPRQFELLSALRASDFDDPARDGEVDAPAAALADADESHEVHELRRRNSEWDDAIRSALHEVPVPANWHARLRQELALPEPQITLATTQSSSSATTASGESGLESLTRRNWLRTITAIGAATCAGAAGILLTHGPSLPDLSEGDLQSAAGWLRTELRPDAWLDYDAPDAEQPPARFALPRELRVQPQRWQPLAGETLHVGAAYDFQPDACAPGGAVRRAATRRPLRRRRATTTAIDHARRLRRLLARSRSPVRVGRRGQRVPLPPIPAQRPQRAVGLKRTIS